MQPVAILSIHVSPTRGGLRYAQADVDPPLRRVVVME
jgi:hypothetical protein